MVNVYVSTLEFVFNLERFQFEILRRRHLLRRSVQEKWLRHLVFFPRLKYRSLDCRLTPRDVLFPNEIFYHIINMETFIKLWNWGLFRKGVREEKHRVDSLNKSFVTFFEVLRKIGKCLLKYYCKTLCSYCIVNVIMFSMVRIRLQFSFRGEIQRIFEN